MFTGYVPHNKQSFNGYHRTSNGLVPAKTEVHRMRNRQNDSSNARETDIYQTRVIRICCLTVFIVLAIENTCLYPRKTEFKGGILFSACPSFYNSMVLSVGHSINI